MAKKWILIGIGIPGCGKTYTLTAQAQREGATYICPDDIRNQIQRGDRFEREWNEEVWRAAHQLVDAAMKRGENIIFDSTMAQREHRLAFIRHCKEQANSAMYEFRGLLFLTPVQLCLERNRNRSKRVPEDRILRMLESLRRDPPTKAEGFDALQTNKTSA